MLGPWTEGPNSKLSCTPLSLVQISGTPMSLCVRWRQEWSGPLGLFKDKGRGHWEVLKTGSGTQGMPRGVD